MESLAISKTSTADRRQYGAHPYHSLSPNRPLPAKLD